MGCLGGAVGGGFAAIVGLCAKGTGASMIPGMLLYLQGGMIEYNIVFLHSVGVAFAGTWMIMKKNPEAVYRSKLCFSMIFQIIRTGIFELWICRLNIFNGYRRQPGMIRIIRYGTLHRNVV